MEATEQTIRNDAPVSTAAATAAASEIHGIVDNVSLKQLYGWAWNPGRPGERVVVELRLGDTLVAETVAETNRPDLIKSGIGDGQHAFSLPLTAECIERRSEMQVVARSADGTRVPLPFRVHRKREDANLPALDSVVKAVGNMQRRMQLELQEELRGLSARLPGPEDQAAIRSLMDAQARLDDRLEILTQWLTRLDERIAALPTTPPPPPPRRLDRWQTGLIAVLGGVAVLALSGLPTLLAG